MGKFAYKWGVAFALLLTGCAMKHVQVRPEVVIPRACMESVALTDEAECRQQEGATALHCTGFKLTKFKGCEELQVKSKEKK